MQTYEKVRPYWHVDAKWIFGILTTFFLTVSLILSILSSLLSEKTAIPLAAYAVATQFSRDGIDDPKDIEKAKTKYLNSGQDVFYPLPGQNVKITREELATLTPKEIRLRITTQLVEPYYYENFPQDKKEEIMKKAGILAFVNQRTYQLIFKIFLFSIIPVVLALSGLIFFSYKYGRLISPAIVFLWLSTTPTILLFLISNSPLPASIPFLPSEVTKEIARAISLPFYLLFSAGVGLIATTLTLKLFNRFRKK